MSLKARGCVGRCPVHDETPGKYRNGTLNYAIPAGYEGVQHS